VSDVFEARRRCTVAFGPFVAPTITIHLVMVDEKQILVVLKAELPSPPSFFLSPSYFEPVGRPRRFRITRKVLKA
jgi:hypothetical protein